jgi:regulatory protein
VGEDPLEHARQVAIALLARRDFASTELQAKLESRGVAREVAAHLIGELVAERTLDDARFAASYATTRASRGLGPVRIGADLRALGVGGELIQAALESAADWGVRAGEVRAKRFGRELPRGGPQRARQARFLQYRGFSSDHIRSALGADFHQDEGS